MLEPNYLFSIADSVVDLYSEFENSIIRDIVRRIIDSGTMTQSARHQIEVLQQAGMLYNDIVTRVSNLTGISEKIVNQLFKEAGTKTLEYDDYIYRKAGLNPLPINQSESMLNILKINTRITNKSLYNLALSTAITGQNKFIELSDMAILQTETGAFDYNTAIWNAIKNVTDSGIYVQYPSGRKDKIDVAIRRNVMTAINQTAGRLQEQRAIDMDCDLVEVSAHIGARPSHSEWQGKIFSRSGKSKKYPDFIESTGYGTATGLCGINCRHSFYPFFEGLSEPSYTQQELDEINNKTVKYNSKEIKEYDALQIQREMERNIRKNKREISACEGILNSSANDNLKKEASDKITVLSKKLREKQSTLKDFTEQTGLVREYSRERVPSYNRNIDKTVDQINKTNVNRYKDNNIKKSQANEEYGDASFIDKNISDICNKVHLAGKNSGYENLALIDNNTKNIKGKIYTKGSLNEVGYSIEQQNLLQMSKDRSMIAVHNHPSNNTFSVDDIYAMIENKKICGIIVTTDEFDYFLVGNIEDLNKSKRNIKRFKYWFDGVIDNEINQATKVDNELYHNLYIKIFDSLGWNYGRKRKI